MASSTTQTHGMRADMHVVVAIVSYASHRDLAACLSALAESTYRNFEVVICENGGEAAFRALSDSLPARLRGGQSVRWLLAERNLGYAGGVNICLAAAPEADAWWILNPDTEPTSLALEAMVARLQRGDCHAVGCTLTFDGDVVQSYGGRWRRALARAVSLGYGRSMRATLDARWIEAAQNYLNGACMLVDRRFVTTAGPMREDYFLYCEEVEWCLRGAARGMTLGFSADGVVRHHAGTSTGNAPSIRERSALSVYLNERNRLLLTRDCFRGWFWPAAFFALALLVLRFGRARAWRQLLYACRGWVAGIRDERGAPVWANVKP
jgi:GT2 family glycosyltransferase